MNSHWHFKPESPDSLDEKWQHNPTTDQDNFYIMFIYIKLTSFVHFMGYTHSRV